MESDSSYQNLKQKIRELEKEASRHRQTEKMLRKQNVYLTALHETTLGLIRQLDVTDVLKTIIQHTASLVDTQHAFLYLYDDREDVLRLKIGLGIYRGQPGYVIRRGEGVAGRVFNSSESLVVNDYYSWEGRHRDEYWKSVQAVAALPLKSGKRLIGVIGAMYTEPGQKFEDDILDLLNPFAELAAIALANARLHLKLQKELQYRKRVEGRLRESERRQSEIINFLPDPTWVINTAGEVIAWNLAIEKLTGIKAADILGKDNYEYALPFYGERRPLIIDLVGNPDHEVEKSYLVFRRQPERSYCESFHPDLKPGGVYLAGTAGPLYDENGNRTGAIESLRDITHRKKAEASLQEKEATMRGILQAAPLGIGMVNNFKERVVVWTNEHFANMLGYRPGDLKGKHASFLYVSKDEFNRVGRVKHPELESRGVGSLEARMQHKDGRAIAVLVSSALVRPENPLSEVVFTALDITDRKEVENSLRESEERFRELAELMPEVIFEIDLQGNLTFANRKAFERFGYTKEEFRQGLKTFDLIVPEDKQKATRNIRRIIRGENLGLNEYRALRKDGTEFPIIIRSAPITREGKTIGLRGFIIDITERKRVEEQLQQVQRMEALGTLAGGIAHDFNNLMMGIQGNASLALLDIDRSHPNHEKLINIELQVKKATELTQQMLGLARGGKYQVSPHNINDVINDCVRMFSRTKKEIVIYKKFEREPWTVKIDRGQIDQVLLNILVNAWQAMPGGGDIYIQTENVSLDDAFVKPHDIRPGEYTKVSIADTGVGMDENTLSRVFDPFFTTKEKERGTGLGLASAYGIVQNHGGIITVESEYGQGATFAFYLPASESGVIETEAPNKKIDGGAETILLVDDEEIIVEVTASMLKKMGYNVYSANGGKEALNLFKQHQKKIDLVILDMIMPDVSGSDTFDRLKDINANVKVLLASGYSLNGQAEEIIRRGCDGFIQKPFDMGQLSDKLRDILEKK